MATGEPQVRVRGGTVCGQVESGVSVFRGIPFAEVPVRFGFPRPPGGWDGPRRAWTFGPPPPQSGAPEADGWLTVNVWTPDRAGPLPVMVWIQGGGYVYGTASQPEYDGARLAREGVVVVTFNYRVGVEGFAAVAGAPANRGLLDQVAALEWVRDNVAGFGGDPDLVTVFGQSAGGGCVAALLAMPRAAGLFRRAVVQSMPSVFLSPELAGDIAQAFAADLGLGTGELASVPPGELALFGDAFAAGVGAYADRWGPAAYRRVWLAPVVDGEVLPTDPWTALSAGAARDVDLVVGHTRDEHRLFALMEGTLGQVAEAHAEEALARLAPGPEAAAHYRRAGSPEAAYERVHADWLFRMPTLQLGEAHVGRTYLYELTWSAPAMDGVLGACHGLDVPLVFGNLTAGAPAMLLGDELADAEAVSAQLREAWIRFAVSGDPGWPAYAPDERLTRVFDTLSRTVPYPDDDTRRLWEQHRFGALPLLGAN
jgi:para-nitrobenzyl esterase